MSSIWNALKTFFDQIDYSPFLGHCLSTDEIRELARARIQTNPLAHFILTGNCCIQLRFAATIRGTQVRALLARRQALRAELRLTRERIAELNRRIATTERSIEVERRLLLAPLVTFVEQYLTSRIVGSLRRALNGYRVALSNARKRADAIQAEIDGVERQIIVSISTGGGNLTDLETGEAYAPIFGGQRPRLYDPSTGQELPRIRLYVPSGVAPETQDRWFDCFRKKPPKKFELHYVVVSMNYFSDEYFEIHMVIPTLAGATADELANAATNLAISLMIEYGVPEEFIFHPNTEFKLGEVDLPAISIDKFPATTDAIIIDTKYNSVRRTYAIVWSTQQAFGAKTFAYVSFYEAQMLTEDGLREKYGFQERRT